MANLSYLWQIISSMDDAVKKLDDKAYSDKPNEVTKLKSLIFDLQQRVTEEVKKGGK